MEIRPARPEEVEEVAALWCDAFPGRRTLADRVRMLETGGQYGGIETVLVARDPRGRLAGACKIYRMTQHLAGAPLPMMGLAAVAVAPYARRRGLGGAICRAALEVARGRGDALSTLYPFRPSYYENLGWGLVGRLLRYRFRTDALPAYDEATSVRPARFPADAEGIAACFDAVVARSNGPIRRDRRIWAYRLSGEELGVRPVDVDAVLAGPGSGQERVVVCGDDAVTGYAILRSTRARSPEAATLQVRELVADDEAAYRALIGHLGTQRDQWPRGVHFARPEERFGERLSDPRPPGFRESRSLYFPTATIVRGPMLRILDLPTVLRRRPLFSEPDVRIAVRVSDPQLPANDGPWRVVVGHREGGAENVVEPGEDGRCEAGLATDAPTLARILAGDIPPSAAARLGRAEVLGRVELLDRALASREAFWLLDEF